MRARLMSARKTAVDRLREERVLIRQKHFAKGVAFAIVAAPYVSTSAQTQSWQGTQGACRKNIHSPRIFSARR